MANPKGNPQNLKPHTTTRKEPLTSKISVSIDKTTYKRLSAIPDKAEFCRNAILKALDQLDIDKDIDIDIDKDKD